MSYKIHIYRLNWLSSATTSWSVSQWQFVSVGDMFIFKSSVNIIENKIFKITANYIFELILADHCSSNQIILTINISLIIK